MAGAAAPHLATPPALAAAPGSLYEALRVRRAATQVEIRAAYRAMAKRLHPDTYRAGAGAGAGGGGGSGAFLEMRRAYETLSDPAERARYDRSLGACWRPCSGAGAMPTARVRRWETDQCW